MNDLLNGQLTSDWSIPGYARDLLWIETESETVQTQGKRGLFTLSAPAERLVLRWGTPEGPALAALRWRPESLDWGGQVRIGGYIDALHSAELHGLPEPLIVLTVGGQPLKTIASPFPRPHERARAPISPLSFDEGLEADIAESVTTWAAFEGSPALLLAQDALVSKLRVWCFGRLADATLHELLALPLLLEEMTLFAP